MGSGLTADTQRQQEARDRISMFNSQNQNQRDFANNSIANQTLMGRDQRGIQNRDLRNQQQQMNNNLAQQTFQNRAGVAAGRAGQQMQAGQSAIQNSQFNAGLASQNNQFGQQQQMAYGQMGANAAAGFLASDKTKKEGIEKADLDIEDFLNSITGVRFKYKDPFSKFTTPGTKVGIVAQDIENTLPGQAIIKETDEGKVLDTKEAVSPILASLGNLNERLRKAGI
jgi:hypothetical protein